LTILILFGDYEKLWSSSLYTFHLLLSTSTPSTLLGPGVPSTLSQGDPSFWRRRCRCWSSG
jgi:hypothetical protein